MIFKKEDNQLFYEKYGEGHPIIILHAMGTDHRSMKSWVEPIFNHINGFKRIYLDIPEHGLSKIGSCIKSTQNFLDLIQSFIESELNQQPFSLVGHSYGGYLAQEIMSENKDLVRGLCLLAPVLHQRDRNLPDKVFREVDNEYLDSLNPDIKSAINTLLVYQKKENIQLFLEEVQPGRLLANRKFLLSDWRKEGYLIKNDPLNHTDLLDYPTLLLLGKQDSICGYIDYTPFLEKFSNLTFTILDQAGHLMQIEKREVVQSLFKDWVVSSLK